MKKKKQQHCKVISQGYTNCDSVYNYYESAKEYESNLSDEKSNLQLDSMKNINGFLDKLDEIKKKNCKSIDECKSLQNQGNKLIEQMEDQDNDIKEKISDIDEKINSAKQNSDNALKCMKKCIAYKHLEVETLGKQCIENIEAIEAYENKRPDEMYVLNEKTETISKIHDNESLKSFKKNTMELCDEYQNKNMNLINNQIKLKIEKDLEKI